MKSMSHNPAASVSCKVF